ncbi:L,D-transpeptidase family protein [Psychrobacter arenosus]|uniref:L,D-transpeptidase family protein n=1 Tax=Psychrobacter arenosus TaxID=256326 RepID=UPI001D1101B4|nr:L,D-transpeptidase family protein [Psychrobacter arenosus]
MKKNKAQSRHSMVALLSLAKPLLILALLVILTLGVLYWLKLPNSLEPNVAVASIPVGNIPLNEVKIDKVVVDKSSRNMALLSQGEVVRSYRIALGDNPQGHKREEGDERTPEGIYTLDYKNENSIAHRSIHISYPNAADKADAASRGVSPGGDIMIHGQMNGFGSLANIMQQRDWTNGCIAVTNEEMDEIMSVVELGTPIEIVW